MDKWVSFSLPSYQTWPAQISELARHAPRQFLAAISLCTYFCDDRNSRALATCAITYKHGHTNLQVTKYLNLQLTYIDCKLVQVVLGNWGFCILSWSANKTITLWVLGVMSLHYNFQRSSLLKMSCYSSIAMCQYWDNWLVYWEYNDYFTDMSQ